MKKALAFTVAGMLILFSAVAADIPKLINYQGMLTADTGEPLDGVFDIFFRIYNAESGGDKRWEENHATLSVNQGLFNAILGSQSGGIDLDFSENYWLEIQVESEVMPRIEFTSMGYAYRALVADSALSATPGSGSNWSVSNSALHTNQYWGIARGGAGNVVYGDSAHTMVNLGVACTTGFSLQHAGYVTLSGGFGNSAGWWYGTVGGGEHNSAGGMNATIGGGRLNNASGFIGTVAGGDQNIASGGYAAVGGGVSNTASGGSAAVAGGFGNTSSGIRAAVGGGFYNTASGEYSVVPGGICNTASGDGSFAAGWRAKALHAGSFVWADTNDVDFASTGANQFLIRASGGVGIGTNSPSAESRLHVQAVSDDFGVLVDAAGTSGTEIGLHTSTSQYASLAKNAYFDAGWWQRFNTSQGAYLQEVKPDGEVWFRVVDAGANPVSWTNALTIKTNGNVGIGTADPQGYKLAVNGDAAKTGSSTWASYSDLRLKEIDGRYEHGLSEICDLQAVRYRYKQDNRMGLSAGQQYVGLIAQEVQEVIPEAVKENGEGYLMLQSDPIIWAMLNAIKELKAENEELKTRIKKLETP